MPNHATLSTGYSSCWIPGDSRVNPIYGLHSGEPNRGALLSKLLTDKFERIKMNGGMWVIMISFSQPGFMESEGQ